MKKVMFDMCAAQPLGMTKFHGGGEYVKAIYYEIINFYLDNIELMVFYNPKLYIDEWILESFKNPKIRVFHVMNASEINDLLVSEEIDCFFEGMVGYKRKINIPKDIISIGTFHGASRFLEIQQSGKDNTEKYYKVGFSEKLKILIKRIFSKVYSRYVYQEFYKGLKGYKYLVAASEYASYSLRMFYPQIDKLTLKAFYSTRKYVDEKEQEESIKDDKYILMVSVDRWEKNSFRGIMALDKLFSAGYLEDYTVHLTGVLPHAIERRIKNKGRFIIFGYLSSKDLEKEYAHCSLFFYPTLNEAFGYPPLEAMRYGKTCLISCRASLPELFSGVVYFCNPIDLHEMKIRLLMAIDKPISERIIQERYDEISKRQKQDTIALCRMITE